MNNLRHLVRIPTGLSYLLKRENNWGQPVFFTIETVNSCNLRCTYCPQSGEGNHFINGQGTMSFDDFKKIIANIRSAFDVGIVSLHRDGEPLMNKRLEDFVAHLAGLGIYVTMSTNCSLLPEERAKRLIASGLRMATTDFCADPELYERLRVRGVWAKTLDGIKNLLRAGVEAKTDFRMVIKDIATNNCPPGKTGALMARTSTLFAEWPGRVDIMPVYFHNALGESLVNLSNAAAPAQSQASDGLYSLCHHPWVNFTVDYAGRVVGCCRDLRSEYVLGSLLHEQAADIWNGERNRQLRRALAEKHPERISICKSCDVPWQGSYSGRTALEKARNFFFTPAWKR
jgi:radical SAM protein with 4Fe4S-binding SPASM domain